ncbi:prokineticin 2 [Columba livia]|uniref:Prokineticin 2 n=1 Tax=Columba livia TaxID=8932 RepID=A0A2I0M9M0_COLLI|nr:prokineticin 2 [Columba livia]
MPTALLWLSSGWVGGCRQFLFMEGSGGNIGAGAVLHLQRYSNIRYYYKKACDRDQQCGGGMCCAVSLWIRSLRMCTPMGNLGEECHPLSHRVPFSGRRMHHTCPCLPGLACLRTSPSKFKCLPDFRKEDVFF